ncbi:hypothetical protein M0802_001159 [Mischocyttarus mexicanus]|nr:hypothetical protein M0802_001159 [Mischocyttarus mexicanus]
MFDNAFFLLFQGTSIRTLLQLNEIESYLLTGFSDNCVASITCNEWVHADRSIDFSPYYIHTPLFLPSTLIPLIPPIPPLSSHPSQPSTSNPEDIYVLRGTGKLGFL